jgi:HSP20 family protein
MTIIRPRVFPEMPTLRETIDRLFDESLVPSTEFITGDGFARPALDAFTTPEAFVVKAAVPGIKPDALHTTITGNVLTIEGEFSEEAKREEAGYLVRELSRRALRRSLTLPVGLKTDEAQATYAEGILTLTIPKAEEARPREIEVKAA